MSLDHSADFVKSQSLSEDRFLGGQIVATQPAKGFRAGTDSVLLGASVQNGCQQLLELGSGVGVASLVALHYHSALEASLTEREPSLVGLARENLVANGFEARARVLELDVTATGAVRSAAGLAVNHFDCVIANPPFFNAEGATLPASADRASARHAPPDTIGYWVRTAAASSRSGGDAIFLYPAEGLGQLLEAFGGRFGGVCILPLAPKDGMDANRVLVRGTKGSRAPLKLLAPLNLHSLDGGGFSEKVSAVLTGLGPLRWNI